MVLETRLACVLCFTQMFSDAYGFFQVKSLESELAHFKKMNDTAQASLTKLNYERGFYVAELDKARALNQNIGTRLNAELESNDFLLRERAELPPTSDETERTKRMMCRVHDQRIKEVAAIRDKCTDQMKGLYSKIESLENALFQIDGTSLVEHYKNLFHGFLVVDSVTGEPIVNPHTGEVIPKYKAYEKERNEALAELEEMRKKMPSKEMEELLERVKLKTRQFKRKYKALKTFLRENEYMDDFDDKFCDVDRGHEEDSDDDIRLGGPRKVVVYQDIGLPFGFTAKECGDEYGDD